MLDRLLAHYRPQTKEIRGIVHTSASDFLDRTWSRQSASSPQSEAPTSGPEVFLDKVQELSPKDDKQRALQGQAVSLTMDLGRMRWLQYMQGANSISMPLLVILVFWLTTIFMSFGLYAPANGTVLTSLFVAALSVSGAILLILEMYAPYKGLIQVSSAPLRNALMQMGR